MTKRFARPTIFMSDEDHICVDFIDKKKQKVVRITLRETQLSGYKSEIANVFDLTDDYYSK